MTTYYDKTNHSPARGGGKMHLCSRELFRNNTMLVYLSFLCVRQREMHLSHLPTSWQARRWRNRKQYQNHIKIHMNFKFRKSVM
jgi:hypothetical protein